MFLLCRLRAHVIAPMAQYNQGFFFSRCLRCDRDMIRSDAARSLSRWKRVPAGFRVTRHRRLAATPVRRPKPRSFVGDVSRIAGTTLLWCLVDAWRDRPAPKPVIRRLTAA